MKTVKIKLMNHILVVQDNYAIMINNKMNVRKKKCRVNIKNQTVFLICR